MAFRKAPPPTQRRVPKKDALTGELRKGCKRIQVRPNLWIESKRKPSVVKAEYEAKKLRELESLRSKRYDKPKKREG